MFLASLIIIHYSSCHAGLNPSLEVDVLRIEPNTVRRKIFEAMFIINLNPTINKREELDTIKRFIIANTEEF